MFRRFRLDLVGFSNTQTLTQRELNSEFNSIHFGIEINKKNIF